MSNKIFKDTTDSIQFSFSSLKYNKSNIKDALIHLNSTLRDLAKSRDSWIQLVDAFQMCRKHHALFDIPYSQYANSILIRSNHLSFNMSIELEDGYRWNILKLNKDSKFEVNFEELYDRYGIQVDEIEVKEEELITI